MRYLYSTTTPDVYGWTRGTELLAAAGVPVHPLVPGALVYVTEDPRGSGRAPLWVLVSEKPWEGAREVADDAIIVGKPRPLLDRDLAAVRLAALSELSRLGAALAEEPVRLEGRPPLGVGVDSQRDWTSLLTATSVAEALGFDPSAVGVYPFPFPARDGSVVVLENATAARVLYFELFAHGAARRKLLDAAAQAVYAATTSQGVADALLAYRGSL